MDRRTDRRMKATTKSSKHTHVVVVVVVVYLFCSFYQVWDEF